MVETQIYKVSELTKLIKENLETNFKTIWIEGEVSNLKIPSSGHIYFTLKDEFAQIQAVIFKTQRKLIRFDVKDGLSVIANGRITVYEARGVYQIIIDYIEPKGIGALQLAFEQLKAKLAGDGLFEEKFKKKLPFFPKKIGIVTSPTGAAIRDIIHVINRRFANLHILVYPVKVQGDEAAKEIANGIEELNKFDDIDVLIIGRGGGSIEDLWAFNEEIVARAIFASKIPVISAVGHEIDFTISDFVADVRAPTPSAAAELVISSKEEIQKDLHFLQSRLKETLLSKIKYLKKSVELIISMCKAYAPLKLIQKYYQKIDELTSRIDKKTHNLISGKKESFIIMYGKFLEHKPTHAISRYQEILGLIKNRFQSGMKSLIANYKKEYLKRFEILNFLNPYSQLGRGYCICQKSNDGSLVKYISQVKTGEKLSLTLKDGKISCEVD